MSKPQGIPADKSRLVRNVQATLRTEQTRGRMRGGGGTDMPAGVRAAQPPKPPCPPWRARDIVEIPIPRRVS